MRANRYAVGNRTSPLADQVHLVAAVTQFAFDNFVAQTYINSAGAAVAK